MAETEFTQLGARKNLSREARRWLAKLQKAWFLHEWGVASIASADTEFARDEGGYKTGSVARRKPFEGLVREETSLPDDVVRRLDRDSRFAGIHALSNSLFWTLFDSTHAAADAIRLVDQILAAMGLKRLSVGDEEKWIVDNRSSLEQSDPGSADSETLAWKYLKAITSRRPVELDVVALLGALYRELHLTHELEAALVVRYWFWEQLEEFLSSPSFDEVSDEFMDYAVNRLLYGESVATAPKSFGVYSRRRLPGHPIGLIMPTRDFNS